MSNLSVVPLTCYSLGFVLGIIFVVGFFVGFFFVGFFCWVFLLGLGLLGF